MQFVSFSLCSINSLLSYIIIYVMYNVYGICWRSDISLNLYVVALKAQGKRKRRRTKYEGEIHKNTVYLLESEATTTCLIISYAHSCQDRFEPFYRSKCLLVVVGCRHDICNNINSAFPVVTLESQVNYSTIFYVLRFVFYFAGRIFFLFVLYLM